LTEEGQTGFVNTYDGDGTPNSTTSFDFSGNDLNLTGSTNISGHFGVTEQMNFGNFETFSISGTKYTDDNGDGATSGDVGLGGVTIFIDVNKNGTYDAGTDDSTVTASDGTWSFTGLDASYAGLKVYEVLPNGYVQTLGSAGYTITGTSGTDQTGLDFGNFEKFDISGTKYTDDNGDGDTTGDVGLGGVTIFIDVNKNGTYDAGTDDSTVTASDGSWSFTDLDASYAGLKVYEVLPSGYVETLGDTGYTITGTSGADQTGLDFANFELFDISGTKYNDANGDGDTTGDSGLGNVTIFIDVNKNGTYEAGTDEATTTANDGSWSFTDLDASYAGLKVYEVLPSGYIQTLGDTGYVITGTSGADQTGLDFANFLPNPSIDVTKYVKTDVSAAFVDANDPDGPQASTNTTVDFKVVVTNDGNEALSGISISDTIDDNGVETNTPIDYTAVNAQIDIDNDGIIDGAWSDYDQNGDGTLDDADGNPLTDDDFVLGVGDSFAVYYSLDSALGQHENTAAVEATSAISDSTVTDEDDANYYVVEEDCVGVRTPGFWANTKWGTFWDGVGSNQPPQAGTPGFAAGELLYAVDSDGNGVVNPMDTNGDGFINGAPGDKVYDNKPLDTSVGLLIGDYNKNGITDAGEDTVFISLADAKKLINASSKQLVDGKTADGIYMLGRDVVAAWLNYLANNPGDDTGNCIGPVDPNDGKVSPREYLNAAIDWLQQFASTSNADDTPSTTDTNTNTSFHDGDAWAKFEFDARVAPSSGNWQNPVTVGEDIPYSAAAMHSAIDGYNNTGKIAGIEYCCDADSELVINVLSQVHESLF